MTLGPALENASRTGRFALPMWAFSIFARASIARTWITRKKCVQRCAHQRARTLREHSAVVTDSGDGWLVLKPQQWLDEPHAHDEVPRGRRAQRPCSRSVAQDAHGDWRDTWQSVGQVALRRATLPTCLSGGTARASRTQCRRVRLATVPPNSVALPYAS